jgi:uncharacterized protein YukE
MGSDSARLDAAALRDVARQFDASAGAIDAAVSTHMSALSFGGATAGRAYAARGDALRAALERVADALAEWSRASAEIAAALRSSADQYVSSDARAAAGVG